MIAENTPEWFAARVGIPTASLLADIMSSDRSGKAPGAPFARLVAEKAVEILEGSPRPTTTTWAMQRGIDLEPAARMAYEADSGLVAEETGFLLADDMPAGCSLDGSVDGFSGIVEISARAWQRTSSICEPGSYRRSTFRK